MKHLFLPHLFSQKFTAADSSARNIATSQELTYYIPVFLRYWNNISLFRKFLKRKQNMYFTSKGMFSDSSQSLHESGL